MNSKVYYGEYSLSDWVNMLLKGDIEIPPYQRYFVWERSSVIELIKAFKDNRYVPPITICKSIGNDKKEHNYIVDGQQRLSAIFMYKFDFYHNSKKRKDVDLDEENGIENYKEWTIDKIIKNNQNDIDKIIEDEIAKKDSPYESLFKENEGKNLTKDKELFLENEFLGFAYIILENTKEIIEQQRFYAQVFNNINSRGVSLTPEESRKAYYFIVEKYTRLFNINFENIDFVRYLAILSEYHKSMSNKKDDAKINSNISSTRKLEDYIIDYIINMSENESKKFTKIEEIFINDNYEETKEIKYLRERLSDKFYEFDDKSSIIDKDIKLFGLIYSVLFLHKELTNLSNIEKELDIYIKEIHSDKNKTKAPNSNKNLNDRLSKSIEIYKKYIKE